ncbi:hypothetical protein SBDP2_1250001 [Syntrophobacter sp. SbD2]|nr:hypothetical protein SBDP2_1250001 [Syntrophobacter sp. SbD2]
MNKLMIVLTISIRLSWKNPSLYHLIRQTDG